jgi:polysaccharide deacetylase family sporulation protein PdaB
MPRDGISVRNVERVDSKAKIKKLIAGAMAIVLTWALCLSPSAELPIGVYRNHENTSGKIALTFDDGPHPRYTSQILDILEQYGVRATFFVVGENVSYYPEAAREIVQRGHEIGNHTYTHPRAVRMSTQDLRRELKACEDIIQSVTDSSPKLFRPPEGSWNMKVLEIAREMDYPIILWDVDTLDWAHTPAAQITSYVLENTKGGNIILMHDYQSGGCETMQALKMFIPELLSRGFSFVTVSELLGSQ